MSDSASPSPSSRGDAEPFPPDNWEELAPLIDAVLDAPADRRAAILIEVSAGDAERRAELERLVAECERELPLLDRPAAEQFAALLVEEAAAPLPEILGGRYRLDRELGRGGMAVVYLARDVKHSRDVAVKVIRPELAASLGRGRFLREIEIAARLRHPNIVPLYDSGDTDGVLYFVMPYEEGPSLRARLTRAEALPIAECVSTLRDVARALAYAHEHGVVHRDVKPDNVMLSGGAAVVTDFGIAKAVSVAQSETAPGTLTQSGAGIGTPAYMSPEQALGDPSTDHRADIYSFGCLAYELFTGKPPFHGVPTHQIIGAHVSTKPIHVAQLRADVPKPVARLVARCLEKNPGARPQTAQELLADLEGGAIAARGAVRLRRLSRARRVPLLLLGVLVLAGASYAVWRGRASTTLELRALTLAVLPLRSLGGDSLQNVADGFSDEIAAALFKVAGVRAMSRRSVGKYSGQRNIDPQKTGHELGARFLLMGSLRENAGKLTVTISLVDAADGSDLWADVFERTDGDFTAVREDIIRSIGQTLRTRFGAAADGPAVAPKAGRAVNTEAYRLYLLAQGKLNKRGQNVQESADLFRRAAALDTLFAKAYSGLSLALALTPHFQYTWARDITDEAISSAQHALRLDASLAQPHVALALVYQFAYQWSLAAKEHESAIRLRSPDDVEPLVQYGRHLLHLGRTPEGLTQFLAARSIEPASALVSSWVSTAYYREGQLDSALAESERAFQNDSTNLTTLTSGALVRLKAGRLAAARDFASRISAMGVDPVPFYILAAVGDSVGLSKRLLALESHRPRPPLLETSRAYALFGLGDTARAMAALDRATTAGEIWPSLAYGVFDSIHETAHYQALLRRVGLPANEGSKRP